VPFDWDEVIASIAPRAVFINAPEEDFMRVEGVRECVGRVAPVYARAGVPDRLVCVHPDGAHDFPPAQAGRAGNSPKVGCRRNDGGEFNVQFPLACVCVSPVAERVCLAAS